MISGRQLIYSHFERFQLEVHIGRKGKESKMEFVHFTADGFINDISLDKFDDGDGCTGTDKCKYIRLFLHFTL